MRGILGDAAREHCCRQQCAYAVERVRWYLDRLAAFERAGEEPDLRFTRVTFERFGYSPHDGATATIDINRVIEQLLAEGLPISAELVAARLCPFAIEGSTPS